MGYDIHITRKENWFEDEGKEITEAEWKSYVNSDSELRLSGFAEAESSLNITLRYVNPLLADWLGHPDHEIVYFDFRHGNVVVKNPDEITLNKMKNIAHNLRAKVQGDEGEFYNED